MEINRKILAKKLREARGYLTQTDAAKRLGWTQSLICKLESGTREPTALELWRLAQVYKRPFSYFFAEKESKPNFITEDMVAWHVAHYGYNLLVSKREYHGEVSLSAEDTILSILQWFPSPRLIESAPVLLFVNEIDLESLYKDAWRENLQNRLGFIVDVTIECIKAADAKGLHSRLEELRTRLLHVKLAKEDSFLERINKLSDKSLNYLRQTRDPLAAEWNILDRLFLANFKEVFDRAI